MLTISKISYFHGEHILFILQFIINVSKLCIAMSLNMHEKEKNEIMSRLITASAPLNVYYAA